MRLSSRVATAEELTRRDRGGEFGVTVNAIASYRRAELSPNSLQSRASHLMKERQRKVHLLDDEFMCTDIQCNYYFSSRLNYQFFH